jgi:hypothetical protein
MALARRQIVHLDIDARDMPIAGTPANLHHRAEAAIEGLEHSVVNLHAITTIQDCRSVAWLAGHLRTSDGKYCSH